MSKSVINLIRGKAPFGYEYNGVDLRRAAGTIISHYQAFMKK